MSYTPTNWANGKAPALNATNLNKIEQELKKLDDVVSVPDITETTETTMPNSYDGRLLVEEIGGVCEQESTTGAQLAEKVTVIDVLSIYNTVLRIKANFKPSTKYTFSFKGTAGNQYYTNENFFEEEKVLNVVDGVNTFTVTTKDTWESNQVTEDGYAILKNNKEQTNSHKFEQVMLVEGATALSYEPYTGGIPSPNPSYPQEIKKSVVSGVKTHGKNFLNLSTERMDRLTYANGVYTSIPCGAYAMIMPYLLNNVKMYAGKKYYLKAKIRRVSGVGEMNALVLYPSSGLSSVKISMPALTTSYQEYIVELTSDSNMIHNTCCVIQPNGSASELVLEIKDIILCENADDAYEPYTESSITLSQPIELYKIGDVQDVITPKQIKRKFGVKVFDGTENINTQQDSTYFLAECVDLKLNNNSWSLAGALCSRLSEKTPDSLWGNPDEGFCINTQSWYPIRFRIGADVTSVDLAKAKLKEWYDAGNPMIIVYELATETTEALPLADQIALNSLATYDGITYLEFDAEVEPTIKAEYGTSKVGGYTLEALLTARSK